MRKAERMRKNGIVAVLLVVTSFFVASVGKRRDSWVGVGTYRAAKKAISYQVRSLKSFSGCFRILLSGGKELPQTTGAFLFYES